MDDRQNVNLVRLDVINNPVGSFDDFPDLTNVCFQDRPA